MSSTLRTIIIIIVVIIIIIIGAILYTKGTSNPEELNGTQTASHTTTLSKGNSNKDLDRDLAAIDAAVNASASDSKGVDESLNDQPISQTE